MPWDLFPGNRPNKPQSPNDVASRPLARDPRCTTLVVRLYGSAGFVRPLTKYGASLLKTAHKRPFENLVIRRIENEKPLIRCSRFDLYERWLARSVADLSLFSLAF